jgi:hypothetical protein
VGWGGEEVSTKYKVLMEWKFINSLTIQLGGSAKENEALLCLGRYLFRVQGIFMQT